MTPRTTTALIEPFNARMSGQPYRNTYTWYLRLADSKIVEVVAFFDSVAFNDFWTRVQPA